MKKNQNFTLEKLNEVKNDPKKLYEYLKCIAWFNYDGDVTFLLMALWYVDVMRINIKEQKKPEHHMSVRERDKMENSFFIVSRMLISMLVMPSYRRRLYGIVQNIDSEQMAQIIQGKAEADCVLKGTDITFSAIACVIQYFRQTECEKVTPLSNLDQVMLMTEMRADQYLPDELKCTSICPCQWYKTVFPPVQ